MVQRYRCRAYSSTASCSDHAQRLGTVGREQLGEAEGFDAPAVLPDMAWTALAGRSHFDYRAGLVFSRAKELRQKLEAVADGIEGAGSRKISKVAFVWSSRPGGLTLGRSQNRA